MSEKNFCFGCNEEFTEDVIVNGGTRQFGVNVYHKTCYKELIDNEHKKIHSKFTIKKLFKKPRFIVAWWTPFFWIFIGVFFFIGNALSLNFFKNIIIYNESELLALGSTDPPIVTWLMISTIVSALMILYGTYLFNHTEE